MNSEELEKSLRSELEDQIKSATADMKREVEDFKEKIGSEIEKHRTHIMEMFREFSESFDREKELDAGFTEFVSEHLKIARDEGAKITAAAMAEAEEMREEELRQSSAADAFSDIRDAINDISSKDSQAEILKALIHHTAQYTPRGAFFIVKNEHLVGWRLFGKEDHPGHEAIRQIYFPISSKTSLSESVESLATVNSSFGTHSDDSFYLNPLGFGEPESIYAIPLIIRGRGVAALYADKGAENGDVNVEALEMLMRVAGLAVEILASDVPQPKAEVSEMPADVAEDDEQEETFEEYQHQAEDTAFSTQEYLSETEQAESYQDIPTDFDTLSETENFEYQTSDESAISEEAHEEFQDDSSSEEFSTFYEASEEDEYKGESSEDFEQETDEFEYRADNGDFEIQQEEVRQFDEDLQDETTGYSLDDSADQLEDAENEEEITKEFEISAVPETDFSPLNEEVSESFETRDVSDEFSVSEQEGMAYASAPEAHHEPTVSPPSYRPRFGDRNVDLPIEVEEDERRYHNDARRFARLLVSEIKLYNEQKVKEGRESSDLYERLREAIDRSREMYDKRVRPPVAAKFDYFSYELVNTLAEGDETKLGSSYPGSDV